MKVGFHRVLFIVAMIVAIVVAIVLPEYGGLAAFPIALVEAGRWTQKSNKQYIKALLVFVGLLSIALAVGSAAFLLIYALYLITQEVNSKTDAN